ncbi:MAG: Mur ligase family protein, partial [Caldilinea sp.]
MDFQGRRIVILGVARQGAALARFFVAAGAHVTISDAATTERLAVEIERLGDLPVDLVTGGHPLELLDGCDLLCLSGGVPAQLDIVQEAIRRGIPLSNDSLLTLQLARQRRLGPIVAITGSSGKTTTTTLVGKMLAASGKRVHVGGNIGTPLIDRLETIARGDCVVLELSSFQLELFDACWAWGDVQKIGPDVAAILNITPNHLDRHPDMAAYAAAKFNLLRCLPDDATIVLSAENAVTRRVASGEWRISDPPLPSSWAPSSERLYV